MPYCRSQAAGKFERKDIAPTWESAEQSLAPQCA